MFEIPSLDHEPGVGMAFHRLGIYLLYRSPNFSLLGTPKAVDLDKYVVCRAWSNLFASRVLWSSKDGVCSPSFCASDIL